LAAVASRGINDFPTCTKPLTLGEFLKVTIQNYLRRISWKLIIVHSIGTWFFIHAVPILVYLYDMTLFTAMTEYSFNDTERLEAYLANNGHTVGQLITYSFYVPATWIIGLILGFLVSLYLAIKYNWFWLNSLLVLFIMLLFNKLNLLAWTLLKKIFLLPGKLFDNSSFYLLTNGFILLGFGFFVFFFNGFIHFINRNNSKERPSSPNIGIANSGAEHLSNQQR
jgi:hypothetical protein